MMAARRVLPVSEVLFLFFTARGGSFLSQKEKEKNGGAKLSQQEQEKNGFKKTLLWTRWKPGVSGQ